MISHTEIEDLIEVREDTLADGADTEQRLLPTSMTASIPTYITMIPTQSILSMAIPSTRPTKNKEKT